MIKNLSIKGLLIVSSIFMMLMMLLLVGLNSFYLTQTNEKIDEQENTIKASLLFKDIRYHVIQIQQFLTDVSATSDQGGFTDAKENLEFALTKTEQLKHLLTSSESELEQLKQNINQLHRVGREMAYTYIEKGQAQGNLIMKRPTTGFDDASATLAQQLEGLSKKLSEELFNNMNQAQYSIQHARSSVISLTSLTMLLMAIIMFLFYRRIIPPMVSLKNSMLDISEGSRDLTISLEVKGNCEIGQVAAGFNKFVTNIRKLVTEISQTSVQLAQKGDHMSRVSEETLRRMENLKEETREASNAMDKMNMTGQEVANNAQSVTDRTTESEQEALSGQKIVHRTIDSINNLASKVETAAESIRHLESDIENIDSIVDVISSISEQTNLLALNAAIEAARAGEQGRGFAVVADEVRVLAQRTQQSTQEIQSKIEQLQTGSKDTVKIMEEGQEQAKINVQNAQAAGDSLEKITQAVSTIKVMVDEIATAAQSQANVASLINGNIQTMSNESDITAHNAHQTESSSSDVAELLATLNSDLGRFKIGKDAVLDLSKAKTLHLAWKARLRSYLDGQSSITPDQAVSHHHCDFGKWYYSEGLNLYGHIQELKAVEEPHAKLHNLIKDIIQLKSSGQKDKAEQAYQRIEPLSESIIDLLEVIESKA